MCHNSWKLTESSQLSSVGRILGVTRVDGAEMKEGQLSVNIVVDKELNCICINIVTLHFTGLSPEFMKP